MSPSKVASLPGDVKNITTLVPDIYAKINKGITKEEVVLHNLGEQLAKAVLLGLEENQEQRNQLRMSNFGSKCDRKLWYGVNKPETAEPIEPWVKYKFAYGHIIEALTLFMVKVSGHKVEGEQDEVVLSGVKGHRDAIVDGVLVDVKSANSRGMHKFKTHSVEKDDPFGYLDQLSLYTKASEQDPALKVKKEAAFIAVDKELGHIVLDTYKVKDEDYEKSIQDKKEMLALEEAPRRAYQPVAEGKSGNLALATACSYCPHKNHCWADSNKGQGLRGFFYSSGPKWLTHVAREPDVMEIK